MFVVTSKVRSEFGNACSARDQKPTTAAAVRKHVIPNARVSTFNAVKQGEGWKLCQANEK
jgi:hypothetical protein